MIDILIPVFVETIDEIEEGKLYISRKYGVAIHLCACGCGGKTVMPFNDKTGGWTMTEKDDKVSFTPSVGNWAGESPYHAHYFITQNKIVWC